MPFKVSFSSPSHGWLPISIDLFDKGQFECAASDTPNDFLGEITYAIYRVLQLGNPVSAFAHVEPGAYEFLFSRDPSGNVILEIIVHNELAYTSSKPGESYLTISGENDTVCRAFLFAIRELKSTVDSSDFRSRNGWAWSFPDAGLYNIELLLEGWPADSGIAS